MIVDLHAHYAMHLVGRRRFRLLELLRSERERRRFKLYVRAVLVGIASRFANYRTLFSGERVRVSYMRQGGVRVALSVLYSFFDEFDVGDGIRPEKEYLESIEGQMTTVKEDLCRFDDLAVIARNPAELRAAGDAGKLALVHCVEGGFHLGPRDDVGDAVGRLAGLGVGYITLAHLIYRGVATNAPALPFLTDRQYRQWLRQPAGRGLSDLGEAAVRAMVDHRVLIDVSHMSERSLADTFELLDELDPSKSVPVVATHSGYRFGDQEYMLAPDTLQQIAARDGVVGLILAQHQMKDVPCPALRRTPPITKRQRFDRSFEILCCHIDHIAEATGSHRHTAIGSDFDGFIKPTLPGLEDMRDMAWLEAALKHKYGEDAKGICSANALRPLVEYWQGGSLEPG